MKELIELGLKPYQLGQVEYSYTHSCPNCGHWEALYMLKKMIGWIPATKYMAVFECPKCSTKFAEHVILEWDVDSFVRFAQEAARLYNMPDEKKKRHL